jgi:hypothetical protein
LDWARQLDVYCERTDFTFWSEPINAVTNVAFLGVAIVMYRRTKGVPEAQGLAVILFLIGLGSFAFHTTATELGALMDVAPILAFILYFLFLSNRDILNMRWPLNLTLCVAFFPFAAIVGRIFINYGMGSSGAYAPVVVMLILYAGFTASASRQISRGFWEGACFLAISLYLRSMDLGICEVVPMGTHWAWHLINALTLGHMIAVYHAHILEVQGAAR